MGGLTPAELLSVWENGLRERPVRRALALLAPAHPEKTLPELAALPLGERDRQLLGLRVRSFGSRLAARVQCPGCGDELETDLDATGFLTAAPDDSGTYKAQVGGQSVQFRLPDTVDLEDAAAAPDSEAARDRLIARCITRTGATREKPISPEFVAAVANGIAEVDPQTEIEFALTCPACHHAWSAPFDVADFFWTEVDAAARRLLREVHELAAAYGWPEATIVALSPERRAAYLELVRG